jgi:hypothetical protein
MAEPATITILRQVLDVEMRGTEPDGLALQRRLDRVHADVVLPALESALGRIDPRDAALHVDLLAIDVGAVSLDRLETELAEALRQGVGDYFRRHPPVPATGAAEPAAVAVEVQQQPFAQTIDDALIVFLTTGRLPWSFLLPPGRTLEQLVLAAWSDGGGKGDPPPAIRQRLPAVLAVPEARKRLLIQFTPRFAITVLRSLSPEAATVVEQVEAALGGSSSASAAHHRFTRHVRIIAFAAAAGGRLPQPSVLVDAAWTAISPADRADRTLAATLAREWPGSTVPGSRPGGASVGDRTVPGGGPSEVAVGDRTVTPALERELPGSTVPANGPGGVAAAEPAPARPSTPEAGAGACGLLVDCAGVVLLHPFLPRFFEGLGVAGGDELVEPGRGLCLLHHLATGEPTAPEHRLTLGKALCGVPLEQPVEADVGLTHDETAEATALLEATIRHWVALRSTSPDGLRAEFLQRPGVLSVTGDGDWLLRVEARTVDILLDQLPWGFSSFRLPWMSRLMMVEWR